MRKLFLLPLFFLLAGCWDTNQPERMYYIGVISERQDMVGAAAHTVDVLVKE